MFTGLVSTQCRTRLLFERAAMKLVWLRGSSVVARPETCNDLQQLAQR